MASPNADPPDLQHHIEVAKELGQHAEDQIARADNKGAAIVAGLSFLSFAIGIVFLSNVVVPLMATICGFVTLIVFFATLMAAARVLMSRGTSAKYYQDQAEAAAYIKELAADPVKLLQHYERAFFVRSNVLVIKRRYLAGGWWLFQAGIALGFLTLVLFKLGW